MRIHTHSVNHRRRTRDGRWSDLFNRTIYVTLYGNGDRSLFEWHAQIVLRRPRAEFSLRFHAGTRGSETPWDGHATILANGIYWGHSGARRLAEWLSRGQGRDLSVRAFGSRLYWSVWTKPNEWKRGEFARWRDMSITLNPFDVIFGGPKRYSYKDLDWALVTIDLDGERYPVRLTLQTCRLRRPRGRVLRETTVVEWNAPKGIPTEPENWKGGSTYGSSFGINVRDVRGDWVRQATWLLTSWVCTQRAERGCEAPELPDLLVVSA